MLKDFLDRFNHKTTTWPERHKPVIDDVRALIAARSPAEPIAVLDVGLGLAVKVIGRQNGFGRYQVVKRIETALRRLPLPDYFYENFEAQEIADAFAGLPFRMTLADINPKLLKITAAQLGDVVEATITGDLTFAENPAFESLRGRFDAVFCFATIGRLGNLQNRAAGMANVASFLKPGGLLATDDPERSTVLEPVAGHRMIYSRQ
mgnify:CR=1 FL=1